MDRLIAVYDNEIHGLTIGRFSENGNPEIFKTVFGEQADIIYRILTEQTTKADIKDGN